MRAQLTLRVLSYSISFQQNIIPDHRMQGPNLLVLMAAVEAIQLVTERFNSDRISHEKTPENYFAKTVLNPRGYWLYL